MKIIADGDSWFDFPRCLGTGGGIISHLEDLTGLEIINLAHHGDGTQAMLSLAKDQLPRLERELAGADILLFSGGGNDIAGDQLVTILNQNCDGDPLKAINWDRLRAFLDLTMAMYLDLVELREEIAPNCLLITHEYDFPIPSSTGVLWLGPWLKPSLEWCGWKLPDHQRLIVKMLLAEFARRLSGMAIPNRLHIKTQGTLAETDWHDEMHPNRDGFQKLAEKFLAGFKERKLAGL